MPELKRSRHRRNSLEIVYVRLRRFRKAVEVVFRTVFEAFLLDCATLWSALTCQRFSSLVTAIT